MIGESLANGLWVKTPRIPETFTSDGKIFPLDLPIACFTEWSLGDSLPHTMEYGRVGFGFGSLSPSGRLGQFPLSTPYSSRHWLPINVASVVTNPL